MQEFFRFAIVNTWTKHQTESAQNQYFRRFWLHAICGRRDPNNRNRDGKNLIYLLQEHQSTKILRRWAIMQFLCLSQWRFCPACQRDLLPTEPRHSLRGLEVQSKDRECILWICSRCSIEHPECVFVESASLLLQSQTHLPRLGDNRAKKWIYFQRDIADLIDECQVSEHN